MNKNILLVMIVTGSLVLFSHHALSKNTDNRIENNEDIHVDSKNNTLKSTLKHPAKDSTENTDPGIKPAPPLNSSNADIDNTALKTDTEIRTRTDATNDIPHRRASASNITLNPDHPNRHRVVKGDTLWDISARFLRDPWQWPNVWNANPAIENPHLIYPGDIILLKIVDGEPVLWLERGVKTTTAPQPTKTTDGLGITRLSPQIRAYPLKEKAIPSIPSDAIKQFLKFPRIITKRELEDAGYLVASEDGGLISGTSDKIYARNIEPQEQTLYDIVRPGKIYRSRKGWGSEILGYEMLRIADARVTRYDDPSTMIIIEAKREVLIGDRLLPATEERDLNQDFLPHAPEKTVKGRIIAVLDGVSRIGQFHTVVIDLGLRHKIEVGHVMAIYQTGETIRDSITTKWNKKLKLPDERAGTLMVVHVFERVSYALVMEAQKDMKVFDRVTNP